MAQHHQGKLSALMREPVDQRANSDKKKKKKNVFFLDVFGLALTEIRAIYKAKICGAVNESTNSCGTYKIKRMSPNLQKNHFNFPLIFKGVST